MIVLKLNVLIYKNLESVWYARIFDIAKFLLQFKDVSMSYEITFVEEKIITVAVI